VEWKAGRRDDKSPTVFRICLKTGSTPPAMFEVVESEADKTVRTRTELPGLPPLERTARLATMDEVELVNEELKFPGHDSIYEAALDLIASIVKL